MGINKFVVGILTVSDRCSRGEAEDRSGLTLSERVAREGWLARPLQIVPDERDEIKNVLNEWTDKFGLPLILTTGGTGLGPRDVTPEATRAVIQREIPGLEELVRAETQKKNPFASLSRAVIGVRGNSLIINLPGSPTGALECLEILIPLIPHALKMIQGHGHPVQEALHAHRA